MSELSANEIQRDIDETRAEMSSTISAIQHKLSPAELIDQVLWQLRAGGGRTVARGAGDFAGNLGRTIREHPVPSLLIGTGLAWLAVASLRRRPGHGIVGEELLYKDRWHARYGAREEEKPSDEERMRRHEGPTVEEAEPRAAQHQPAQAGTDPLHPEPERTAAAHPTARRPGVHGSTVGAAAVSPGDESPEEESSAGERARQAAKEARERARHAASDAEERAGSTADQAKEGLREQAGEWSARAREGFARAEHGIERGARETTRRMEGATAGARRGARRAGDRTRRGARRVQSTLGYWIDEHPLAVGAFGLALGAALGALLPATRREDRWFGETRDDLAHRARDEANRGRRVAERSFEAARAEAERQRLTPEGAKEELRETQRAAEARLKEAQQAAGEKVKETQHEMQESIRHTAEKKLEEGQEVAKEKLEETEQAARAKAEETGERFRKVGEAAQRTAKEEAERENLGGEIRGGRRES